MQTTKKAGLGQNNTSSKIFYTLLVLLPSLQFLIFYVFVNINSFSLAFKIFPSGVLKEYEWSVLNFTNWFTDATANKEMTNAIWVSIKSYLISVVAGVPLGMFFSYYMFKRMPGSTIFRVMLFMPSILSGAVIATIYNMVTTRVLGGSGGILEQWFQIQNFDFWDKEHRYATLMFFNIFVSFGTSVLMYTNRMDSIDPEMIEAGNLDGASGLSEFWYIVLPQIFSVVQVFLMTGFAGIFSNQLNSLMLFSYEAPSEVQSVGYLLWRGVARAGGNVTQMGPFAALGLMITIVIVPLTFLFRWAINKIGWSEE